MVGGDIGNKIGRMLVANHMRADFDLHTASQQAVKPSVLLHAPRETPENVLPLAVHFLAVTFFRPGLLFTYNSYFSYIFYFACLFYFFALLIHLLLLLIFVAYFSCGSTLSSS